MQNVKSVYVKLEIGRIINFTGRKNMNKQEFLDRLRSALNGRLSPSQVAENINYYEDYINTEIRKGKSEAEVLKLLGDPRLIARTIVETSGGEKDDYQDAAYQNASYQGTNYQQNNGYYYRQEDTKPRGIRMPGWLWAIIIILIFCLFLSAVFSVLSFLLPILIPLVVVMFLVKLFRDWLN